MTFRIGKSKGVTTRNYTPRHEDVSIASLRIMP
jgi:hypothetical protein